MNKDNWEEEFENNELSCCGGDYCYKDHDRELKDFISKTIKQAEERERAETIELCVKKIEGMPDKEVSAFHLMDEDSISREDAITTLKSIEK
jgi:hypothetical protein